MPKKEVKSANSNGFRKENDSMSNVPTPHIKAKMGEIAEKILMPGDPLRAKFIAENYLSDAVCVNDTRNMLGFTGNYKGSKVTVMCRLLLVG